MNSAGLNSFIFILFSLWQTQVYGQKIEVQGKIQDAGNETSIGFAQVKLLPSGRGFSSDEAGQFRFPVLAVPDQKICIVAAGYVTDTFLIGKGSFQIFHLQPKNRDLDEVVVSGTMNEVQRKESIVTRRSELLGTLPISQNGNLKLDYSYNYHFENSYYGRIHFLTFQHTGFDQLIRSGLKENLN